MTRRISILGATGSIGSSTLDLIERNPDRFEVAAVTAHSNADELAAIARRTGATLAVIAEEAKYDALKEALSGTSCAVAAGEHALIEAAQVEAELVIAAIVGCAGLRPTMAAIEAGRTVGLANKEALVTAGSLMTEAARRNSVDLLPVDSEHNAIFQCLAGESVDQIERLILTASGGPFRTWTASQIDAATPDQAVAHPNWSMGAKISVDSATLMNKGLELIEAYHLFDVPANRLDVVVHPQSAIHSLVEFVDGSMLAQIGPSDMRVPLAYVLGWPERIRTPVPRVRLADLGRMDFEEPDLQRFPALRLAKEVLGAGGAAAVVLNAANEIAVALFLANRIKFNDIPAIVEQALDRHSGPSPANIEDVMELDRGSRADARLVAESFCQ